MHILSTARARSSARYLSHLQIRGSATSTRSLVRLVNSETIAPSPNYSRRIDLRYDQANQTIDGESSWKNAPFEDDDDELADFSKSLSQFIEDSPQQRASISPLIPRHLPSSPLLSHDSLHVRKVIRSIKEKPSGATLTPFQNKLRQNPFAQAISSPVRICQFTKTAVPNYFLLRFKLAQDPRRQILLYVPDSPLLDDPEKIYRLGFGTEETNSEPDSKAKSAQSSIEPPHAWKRRYIGAGAYIPARRIALSALNDPLAGLGIHPKSTLIPTRDFKSPGALRQHNTAWLAQNVHAHVLKLLRARARTALLGAVHLQRGYISGFGSWKDAIKYSSRAGSFLWLRGGENPPEFATILLQPSENSTPRKVPVHNLETLLGRDEIATLKAESRMFYRSVLSVKNRNVTVQLELQLWALQCYLAEHKNFIDVE